MYKLCNDFQNRYSFSVTLVGCGGTGGFVAEGLCRILPSHANLVLVDHDRVEERNLLRQCFARDDLGQFKSEVLARRLSKRFERAISYTTMPVALLEIELPGLVIGCVDNGLARRDIEEAVKDKLCSPSGHAGWWVDAGNGDNYGQVLIGDAHRLNLCRPDGDTYHFLPLPTIQRPDLLRQMPPARDCAAIAEEQGPTINLAMAVLVIEVVRRIIAGTCHWMQLYLDMEAGMLIPVLATPETIKALKRKGGE